MANEELTFSEALAGCYKRLIGGGVPEKLAGDILRIIAGRSDLPELAL